MATPSSSGEVVAIIASLALLTPLVRALHKWHIDIRRTARPADTVAIDQGQMPTVSQAPQWSRMTRSNRWFIITNFVSYAFMSGLLVWIMIFEPAHAATSKDVAFVGMLVTTIVVSSRVPDA
jgi:hypothetical protein